jgi:homoserine kinase
MSVNNLKTSAFAPASIGNVSLGFDLLGAALAPIDGTLLGDSVEVSAGSSSNAEVLTVGGRFAHKLPGDTKDNIVVKCYEHFLTSLNKDSAGQKPLSLHLEKRLPIGSGLGSSASSIVAAFHALNVHFGEPFTQSELLLMMGALEGQISGSVHYDNVAPCYVGGMTLMTGEDSDPVTQLPVFSDWYWVVSYSGLSVSTAAARKILPTQYKISDVLTFGRQLSVFVDALHRNDKTTAARMMHDVIAEPFRKSLLPGFDKAREFATQNGGLAFGISGSGPTVFSVTNSLESAETINDYLQQNYVQNDDGFSHVCRLCENGASIEQQAAS